LAAGIRNNNEVIRSLADPQHGVFLVDTVAVVKGSYANMYDMYHFRPGPEGDLARVRVIADAVRARLDDWVPRDARFVPGREPDDTLARAPHPLVANAEPPR